MIILIVHRLRHLLLNNSLFQGTDRFNCSSWLQYAFLNHCHLPVISIHVSWLELILEVLLVSSG